MAEAPNPETVSAVMKHVASKRRSTWRNCLTCGRRFYGFHRARYCPAETGQAISPCKLAARKKS